VTAWYGHDVPAVAALLAEDHADAWHQVSAWHRTADLLLYHADTLARLRDRVAHAWPPERSPASSAYLDYLDGLIASVTDTREAALTNGTALAGILSTLEDARTRVEAVNREWQWIILPRGPNVTPRWRETLNQQVYERMTAVEQTIFEYTNQLVQTAPYGAESGYDESPLPEKTNGHVILAAEASRHAHNVSSSTSGTQPSALGATPQSDRFPDHVSLASGSLAPATAPDMPSAGDPKSTHANGQAATRPMRWQAPVLPARAGQLQMPGGSRGGARPSKSTAVDASISRVRPPGRGEGLPPQGTQSSHHEPESSLSNTVSGEYAESPRIPPAIFGGSTPFRGPALPHRRQVRRWTAIEGVPQVLLPRLVVARSDPGPGVLGIDR
jgi:hypothetical protein